MRRRLAPVARVRGSQSVAAKTEYECRPIRRAPALPATRVAYRRPATAQSLHEQEAAAGVTDSVLAGLDLLHIPVI